MRATPAELLKHLPEYRDEWVLIHPDQSVKDIIGEVLAAHDEFAPYYDNIALYFNRGSTAEIARELYTFCETFIRYKEETEDHQSSALPTGLLVRGYGDCKHYAGFIGGILDSLNRNEGKKIQWCYRFASYDLFDSTPHHVFIVMFDDGNEIWIDPTPGSAAKIPVFQVDKTIKAKKMALVRNIAGFDDDRAALGIASLTVTPAIDPAADHLNFTGVEKNLLAGMWPDWIGLSEYRDFGGDRFINEIKVAADINAIITQRGGTHQVTPDFVKWVYDNSIRSWNFNYPGGVDPTFDGQKWLLVYETGMNQSGWPLWVITPDGRLAFDHDVQVDDYRNAGIHILTAWAQDLINTYDKTPYPVKPRAVKEFSQSYTGNPGNPNANFFNEARGTSVFHDIGKALESAVNFIKDVGLKVIGSIPRNAFLALVGLNVFHMASHLMDSINAGHWDEIAGKWHDLGGNPDKLKNTIEHGSHEKPIESVSEQVDATVSAVQIAALFAAAAPIIAALLKFLNKDGKLNPFIKATESQLQSAFPDADFSFLNGALTNGGTTTPFHVNPVDDENSPYYNGGSNALTFGSGFNTKAALISLGIAGVVYYMMNHRKPKPQRKNFVIPAAAGVGSYLVLSRLMRTQVTQLQPAPAQQTQLPTSTNQSFASALLPALTEGVSNYLNYDQQQAATDQSYAGAGTDFNLYTQLNQDTATV